MKALRILVLIIVGAVLITGCAANDEADIQALLENSQYVAEGALRTLDDETNQPEAPTSSPLFQMDTFPLGVKFARHVVTPITWTFEILAEGDSADATIRAYFYGNPNDASDMFQYGFYVQNTLGNFNYAMADSALRRVKLYRDDTGWHILSLTAAEVHTTGIDNPISISQIKARVESRNYEFIIDDPNAFFTKDELPTFLPDDTVDVTVTLSSTLSPGDDSSWVFFHHGVGHKPGFGLTKRYRDALYRENTFTFKRTWHIADDSVEYGVRHCGFVAERWGTLFGDSTNTYYARAWALPYIVKAPDQDIPADE